MIKLDNIRVCPISFTFKVNISVKVDNEYKRLILRLQIRNPTFQIKQDGWDSIKNSEKRDSKVRGFIKDKRNYKLFDNLIKEFKNSIHENEGQGVFGTDKQINLLKYFLDILKFNMNIPTPNFQENYIIMLRSFGYSHSSVMNILENIKEGKNSDILNQ